MLDSSPRRNISAEECQNEAEWRLHARRTVIAAAQDYSPATVLVKALVNQLMQLPTGPEVKI